MKIPLITFKDRENPIDYNTEDKTFSNSYDTLTLSDVFEELLQRKEDEVFLNYENINKLFAEVKQ